MSTPKKDKKVKIRLFRRHPRKAFRLGRHVVTSEYQEFELNEAEAKELESQGCKHWLMTPDSEKEAKDLLKKEKEDHLKKLGKDKK